MGNSICSRAGLYLFLVITLVLGQVTVCFSGDKFSKPETILTGSIFQDGTVDPYGNWHIVFVETLEQVSNDLKVRTNNVKYANATNIIPIDSRITYYHEYTTTFSGEDIWKVSISVDTTGGIHIFESVYKYSDKSRNTYHFTVPKLLTLIPGINDHGQKMIDGSAVLVQQDYDATVRICEEQRDQE